MWEIIQANRRKSAALLVLLAVVLVGLGYFAGYFWDPRGGQLFGVLVAVVIWVVMMLTAFSGGERILLATAGAREVKKEDAPQLYNILEEMKIASGLPAMPRLFIIDSPEPNAFAVGLKPERSAVAVTTGLLARLSRDELQGVIGHEVGHINHRDTLFMTLAGVTVGAVVILADLFLRGLWFSSGRRRSREEGQMAGVMLIIALVLAILAPLLAQLIYFACSRKREYMADAAAAQYTRYPQGLASALEKIAGVPPRRQEVNRVLAPMYIVNPLEAHGRGMKGLFSTHPPVEERIRILRSMAGDCSLAGYEEAYRKVRHEPLVAAELRGISPVAVREPAAAPTGAGREQWRAARDLLHRVDGYRTLECSCGMRIKVPPGFRGEVKCPRCGRMLEAAGTAGGAH